MHLRNLLMSDDIQRNVVQNCITSIRMPRSFRDKVQSIADEQMISFSDYTRIALLEKMKRDEAVVESQKPIETQSSWHPELSNTK